MAERVAEIEVHVGLDDAQAVAGLNKLRADVDRTSRAIDGQQAVLDIKGNIKPLERDLARATAATKRQQAKVEAIENKAARANAQKKLTELKREEAAARKRLAAMRAQRDAQIELNRQQSIYDRRAALRDRAEAARARLSDQAARRAHRNAIQAERDQRAAITGTARHEAEVARLQKRYADTSREVQKLQREWGKIRTSRPARQRIELDTKRAMAEMELLRAELKARGRDPIDQKINLDVNHEGVDTLNRWLNALTQTTVRIGPFTTTIAGMARTMLLLGPIFSGLVGQASALAAVLGAGVAGAAGVAAGAVGALGVSLGGIGFLLPTLLRDFKGLNTISKAYHTQVLKTGADSEKAKTKLKEFNHALGEVSPTTRRAFLTLDSLRDRWHKLAQEAKPTFFNMLGEGITTVNHHFDWFRKNTLEGFSELDKGWSKWMKGLRSGEADRILHNLGSNGNRSIQPLMEALGNIATGFGRVAESFSRDLPGLLEGFRKWTSGFTKATEDTGKLNERADKLVDSMRAVGRLVMSVGRVITAFFSPGVDDGTDMINGWADGLNHLAHEMRTTKRSGLNDWFRESIKTANRLWETIKPIAQLFFEWTTIMGGFTNAALDVARPLAEMSNKLADIWAVRKAMQIAFGIFLTGAIIKRAAGLAGSIRTIAAGIGAIKAAGGLGAALKGGLIKFATGGLRGQTPANPMYVWSVNGGGAPGAPVGPAGKPGGGVGGFLTKLPRFAKVGGGLAGLAAGMVALTAAADKISKNRGLDQLDDKLKKLVAKRDITALTNMRREIIKFGGNADDFVPKVDAAIDIVENLNNRDLNKVTRTMKGNWKELRDDTKISSQRIDNLVDYHFRLIAASVGKHSQQAKEAASKNFWQARREINKAIQRGAVDTKVGLDKIEQLWVKTMAMYGFSKHQAKNISKGLQPSGAREEGQSGFGKARGGLIQVGNKGERGQDNVPFNLGGVPSVVANGEQIAVFNHHQQSRFAKAYPGGLEGFFHGTQPRHSAFNEGGVVQHYAGGGIVPVPGFPGESAASAVIPMILSIARHFPGLILTDAYGQGHQSPGHTQFGTAADFAGPDKVMDAAVRSLVAAGYLVGYDGRFGSQAWPGHGPSYVAGGNAHFHVELGSGGSGALASMIEDIPRVMIDGGQGLVSEVGQRVADIARDAANQSIQNMAAQALSQVVGGGGLGGGSMAAKQYAQAQLGRYGWGAGEWPALNQLWQGESGWNPNAVNPSSGAAGIPQALGHGNVFALGDYMAQVNWGLRYIKQRYGSPSAAYSAWLSRSPHWYAEGGIATMGSAEWQRGGKIERPTLMTGEDGHKAPEFVIGTNPAFKNNNLEALRQAADALGVGQARKTKRKHPKKIRRHIGPGKLHAVDRYTDLQGKEEDTNREISIAESKVREPDSFIIESKDPITGAPVFTEDTKAIETYKGQLQSVLDKYQHLVNDILEPMVKTVGPNAMDQLAAYIRGRTANIGELHKDIIKQRKLARSKDDDTKKAATKRLAKDKKKLEEEQTWRGNARDIRSDIKDDLHDAGYRLQEGRIAKGSAREDLDSLYGGDGPGGIPGRVGEELAGAIESAAGSATAEPSLPTQQAALDTERANILREFGGNAGAVPRGSVAGFGGGGGLQLNPASISNLSTSLGTVMNSAIASSGVGTGAAAGAALASGSGSVAAVSSGTGAAIDQSKTVNMEVNNTFLAPPPDPHTYTKGLQFEATALV